MIYNQPMKRNLVATKDGSKTLQIEEWGEHYHSIHGALQESRHVYIQAGLDFFLSKNTNITSLNVLEAGFGTGLNALLACLWAQDKAIQVDYFSMEAYPLSEKEISGLDFHKVLAEKNSKDIYKELHKAKWEELMPIHSMFRLQKQQCLFSEADSKEQIDIVFYDAFGPRVQPELWTEDSLKTFYKALKPGGVFVTYSVKGTAKRALQSLGFSLDIIEGPPGKRHMMRAQKPY